MAVFSSESEVFPTDLFNLKFGPLRNLCQCRRTASVALLAAVFIPCLSTDAALLAYEPFTNTPGSAIIGSSDGFGFNGAWQPNSSSGVATNTSYGLAYADASGNTLVTAGGGGFFQGSTSASSAMQPIRLFNFARGTNGTDATTTWFSFLVVRQGPTGTLSGNLYGRGANVCLDINSGPIQKLAVGNSSGAGSNTVGLIPQGNSGNLVGSTVPFGGATNFVVVRLDHRSSTNDIAYLFLNPTLNVQPSLGSASAVSSNSFDFSFNQLRIFAGGQTSAQQPCAELVVDEYRLGETYADVTPYTSSNPVTGVPGPLLVTNAHLLPEGMVLSGIGGSNNSSFYVLATADLQTPMTAWTPLTTNRFDASGRFNSTNPISSGATVQFFRVFTGTLPGPPGVAPSISQQPASQTVLAGSNAFFLVTAEGTPLPQYQWYFNTNSPIAGATNPQLNLTNVQGANAGAYSVVVANSAGSATSAVAILTVNVPASIITSPASQTSPPSNNVTFLVVANGSAPLQYQWYFNTNTALANATNASFTVTNAQTTNAGAYSVIVTNAFGAATSAVATLTISSDFVSGAFYVSSSTGNDNNPGTIASPFQTIAKGLSKVPGGGVVYLRGETFALSSKLTLSGTGASAANPIRLWAYPGETPVIDSTGNTSDGIGISGIFYHLKGITVMNAGHNGINISGNSNTVEFCTVHDNGNTGLHIPGGSSGSTYPSYNLILNCDSYRNYDPPIGGNADGFSAKWNLGPGNVFRGCRAWENSDDGWDLWMGTAPVSIENCWAFRQGINYWGSSQFNGNGNGFKLGGNYVGAPHRLSHSVAFGNAANGVDQNNNIAGQTLDQNTSWANGSRNYSMAHGTNTTPHVVRNNLSIAGASSDTFTSGTLATNNSWQVLSPAASTNDVQSIDVSVAVAPRQPDGSLPVWPLLRPIPGGRLIDKGVYIGEPYNGTAPDLGAFEY